MLLFFICRPGTNANMASKSSQEWSLKVQDQLRANLEGIQSRIDLACESCGRSPTDVRLVAVTKYTPTEIVAELIALQQTVLGENRPQQLIERAQNLSDEFSWHLIGQLQRNKVRAVLPYVSMIHSVDSTKLLKQIDRVAAELELRPQLLLQVNVSGEDAKSGLSANEVRDQFSEIMQFHNVDLSGLMTMAPQDASETMLRKTFAGLRELRDELNASTQEIQLTELSMGMSGDFETAIAEGATLIRLGSVLFAGCDEIA